jgi:predicted PurR-regulated permease PerM
LIKKVNLTVPNFAGYFLLLVIAVLVYYIYVMYSFFLTSLIFAAIFATIFFPVYKVLNKGLGGYSRVASFITCIFTLLIIALPLALIITLLIFEVISALEQISAQFSAGAFDNYIKWEPGYFVFDSLKNIIPNFQDFGLQNLDLDLIGKISQTVAGWGQNLKDFIIGILGNLFDFVLGLIIFFFALYYFYKDGEMINKKITSLIPLPLKHGQAVFKKFKEISLAMIFGIFFTAIIQGTLAGIGFAIVGIPNPIFWAVVTAVFSLVPLFGTGIIWLPASLILIATGNWVGGIGLILWGSLIVATVDNFVRPFLIEGRAPVHPLLTFLSVLGGVFAFGPKGIIYGPIILNLLIAFLHIYELEYKGVLSNK